MTGKLERDLQWREFALVADHKKDQGHEYGDQCAACPGKAGDRSRQFRVRFRGWGWQGRGHGWRENEMK
ncbi:MAG TPA: hypothetical protein VFS95_07735 [Telluria sp.]|nr:hypothetical protein [Telluria sp.]